MAEFTQVVAGDSAVENSLGVVNFAMANEVEEVCGHGLKCTFARDHVRFSGVLVRSSHALPESAAATTELRKANETKLGHRD
jgi:hypothetical protein